MPLLPYFKRLRAETCSAILATTEMTTATLKVVPSTAKLILATDEVITITLKLFQPLQK